MSVVDTCKQRIAGWFGKAKQTRPTPVSVEDHVDAPPPTPRTGDASEDESN